MYSENHDKGINLCVIKTVNMSKGTLFLPLSLSTLSLLQRQQAVLLSSTLYSQGPNHRIFLGKTNPTRWA